MGLKGGNELSSCPYKLGGRKELAAVVVVVVVVVVVAEY